MSSRAHESKRRWNQTIYIRFLPKPTKYKNYCRVEKDSFCSTLPLFVDCASNLRTNLKSLLTKWFRILLFLLLINHFRTLFKYLEWNVSKGRVMSIVLYIVFYWPVSLYSTIIRRCLGSAHCLMFSPLIKCFLYHI